MTEADKLELRRQTWEALGWEIIPAAFCENEVQKLGIGRPPGSATTQLLPAIESSIDIALDAFEKFCKQRQWWFLIETSEHDLSYFLVVFGYEHSAYESERVEQARITAKTLASAICKAIVTIARKK